MGDKQITVPLNMVKQVLLVVTPENHIDYKGPYCHLPKIMEIMWTLICMATCLLQVSQKSTF